MPAGGLIFDQPSNENASDRYVPLSDTPSSQQKKAA
jgi:hypothetical protein